jgi:hypothetical protein
MARKTRTTDKSRRAPSSPPSPPVWIKDEDGLLHAGPAAPPVRHPNIIAAAAGLYSLPLMVDVEEIERDATRGRASRVGAPKGGESTRLANEELETRKQAAFERAADEVRSKYGDRFIDTFDNPYNAHLFKAREFADKVVGLVREKYKAYPEYQIKPDRMYKRLRPYWIRFRKNS